MSYWLLLLFFVTEYVRPSSYVPALEVLKLNSVIPLSAFLATVARAGSATKERMITEPNTRIVLFFLFLVWMSVLTSDVQEFAWIAFTKVLGFVIAYWILGSELTSVPRIKGVFKTLIVAHLMVAALNPVLFTDPGTRHYVTSGAFLGDGNDLALSIDIIIPLCLFLLLDAKKVLQKLVWAGALVICVAVVVLTQSRGGTVGLACMGLYYWAKSRKKFQTALIAAVVVALIFILAPGAYFERMNMIGDTQEGSASARIMAWTAAVRMARDHPLLGVGAAHFPIKIGNEYRTPDVVGSGMNAHSIYFSALGELGLPGFGVLLYFIFSNLAANRRLAQEVRARATDTRDTDLQILASTSAAVIAFASAGAFLSALYYPHLWVLGGVLVATRHVVRERSVGAKATAPKPAPQGITYHWALREKPAHASAVTHGVRR